MDLPDDLPAEKAEEFAAQVAADLSPEMSGTFGAIHVEDAGGARDVWTALGWQHDGSSVYLHIDSRERSVELHLNTRGLERPVRHARVTDWAMICIAAGSTAAGIACRSWLLGIGLLVVTFGTWVFIDIRRQAKRERLRTIDAEAWNARLQSAVAHAKDLED